MATKTISVRIEAYEKLRAARRYPNESFSEVILRARWEDETATAAELLEYFRTTPPHFSSEAIDLIAAADAADRPPQDKWTTR
jgi:predicted CopG family antitoxin